MKLPFVTRATHDAVVVERDLFRFITSSRTLEIAELRDEIADRIRSETDAREQLRALKASAVMRDPKTGRLLPKVVG